MILPINLPGLQHEDNEKKRILAADIGGTKTNLALYRSENQQLVQLREGHYPSANYDSFSAIVQAFLAEEPKLRPDRISIGVAGPVLGSKVKLTNLSWILDKDELKQEFDVEDVLMINDLRATAYGLASLDQEFLTEIHEGDPTIGGNVAILAPGTGLGEAGLYWDGQRYHPFSTEGGHCHFSPVLDIDMELYKYVRQTQDVVSWEHFISGSGIHRIYKFLKEVKGHKEPAWLTQRFEADDPAAVVSHTAMRELDDTCMEAMEIFVRYMAYEASNLVLKLKATGGVYLGGGISPKIYPLLKRSSFTKHFVHNDRMEDLLQRVPIRLILDAKTALRGAAYHGAYWSIPE